MSTPPVKKQKTKTPTPSPPARPPTPRPPTPPPRQPTPPQTPALRAVQAQAPPRQGAEPAGVRIRTFRRNLMRDFENA